MTGVRYSQKTLDRIRSLHDHISLSSGGKRGVIKQSDFVSRFVEICETSEPAKIQRLLNISYQTAKNYLQGRIPQSDVLISISQKTSCSIDWLLTGRGKKFIDDTSMQDTPILSRQIKDLIRSTCVEVINEMNGSKKTAQPKVVVLQSSELMSEKVTEDAKTLTGRTL